ncbi:Acetyl-CoA acetyltransferase, cytosolic [Orchesella cincta]|uniref:Acetyl-CoA acetyltransferase, cytosolic n=1 Tax=Orchesella cincta TaxID=48709 RepID=A0A1D2MPK1_ORCCI|nr:Acetyl-CoA acetyltransferase, cytosolic [Orchesella cincta]
MSALNTESVVILSAVRTPVGSFCGSLSSMKAHDLGAICIKEAINRAGVAAEDVSEVIFGQVLTAGQGQNPARQAAVNAGLPYSVPATSINMLCGSGLRSVVLGAQAIKLGDSKIVVAGGQESMSQAQHSAYLRTGIKMGDGQLVDTMIVDGLTDAFHKYHMGITAENVADQHKVTRGEQDEFALKSQQNAKTAMDKGLFNDEIVAVQVPQRKGAIEVKLDEYPKPTTTLEGLQGLRPAFKRDGSGTVTAGNASGINDGAAAVTLASESLAKSQGLKPVAKIVSYAQAGVDPAVMGVGPIPAVLAAVKKAGWTLEQVDKYELNEAFAAQSLAVVKALGVNPEKVNINGGAIALGHPIGASGARVLCTLINVLKQTGGRKGVAGLCIGGGMGIAISIELCE